VICFLNPDEVEALLGAPDLGTWHGRRHHVFLTLTVQTGLRVCELTNLTISDIHLSAGANVHFLDKSRKNRVTR
jgi:site-specific recombinase XerD